MGKDAYWFRHDSNAGRDLKMLTIKHIYNHWGIGIFWETIEFLREQEDYRFSSKESDLQILCTVIGCNDIGKFMNWYKDCVRIGLFIEENNIFYSASLILRMKKWESSKYAGIQSGIVRSQRNSNETRTNSPTKLEHNRRGDKSRGDIITNISFVDFWNLYEKKVGDRNKLEKKWIALTNTERSAVMNHIPKYKQAQPDKKFRKDPSTYLNNKSWNDEIIPANSIPIEAQNTYEESREWIDDVERWKNGPVPKPIDNGQPTD